MHRTLFASQAPSRDQAGQGIHAIGYWVCNIKSTVSPINMKTNPGLFPKKLLKRQFFALDNNAPGKPKILRS
jgi:hypothetical protein